jgi:hypothetical protein
MDDVEFLGPGANGDGDDDVLTVGPRRKLPRWFVALVAVLAVALVSAGLVARAHRSPHGDAQPSVHPAPHPGIAVPLPRIAGGGPLGPATLALALGGNELFTLDPAALKAFDLDSTDPLAAITFDPVLSFTDRYYRILYDAVQASIWVVPIGGRSPGRLLEFGAVDLRPIRGIQLPTTLASAAVLGGAIYLGTADRGLLRVVRGGRAITTALPVRDGIGPLVADPDRRRLLYLTDGSPTLVRSWSPGRGPGPGVGRLDIGEADLVVVSGSIWAAGFRGEGAAVVHLDPETLRPVGSAAGLVDRLGPGALIVAGGDRNFFVRGESSREPLWCVDGRTGAIDQLWDGPAGLVAAGPGQVWVADPSGVRSLVLRGCVG